MFDPQQKQKDDAQKAVKKMQPLVKSTSKKLFTAASKTLAKQSNISKHDFCKNIERKLGPKAAKEEFKKWK